MKNCLEKAFAEIICETLLEPNFRIPSVLFEMGLICYNCLSYMELILISISESNNLVKKKCLKKAFAEIICETLLKPKYRVTSVFSKYGDFYKCLSYMEVIVISISE